MEKQFALPQVGEEIVNLSNGNIYCIGDKIGEGNFGIVFACHDNWENELAAKVLKPRGLPYKVVKDKFLEEIDKLLSFRHPNITYIFDAFEYRDAFYLITERCYDPVSKIFEIPNYDGYLWVKAIARCVLQALHYIHVQNWVHQDVHLGNVLYSIVKDEMAPKNVSTKFKLADFGISKIISEVDQDNTMAKWMRPPEVLNPMEFGSLNHKIDIYHTGLLLLQIINGRRLQFKEQEILDGIPRENALKLQEPYKTAIEKSLRRHVAYRTNSALELWNDLKSA